VGAWAPVISVEVGARLGGGISPGPEGDGDVAGDSSAPRPVPSDPDPGSDDVLAIAFQL
jgi:hypothetical protein